MESNTMIERLGTHAKNLGRLSVSILEHYVQKLTGEKAIEILKEPYEREKRLLLLVDALSKTESEIKKSHLIPDKYLEIQLKNSTDLIQAMDSFQKDIDFASLPEKLKTEFTLAFSEEQEAELAKNAKAYASVLQKKVVSVSDETAVSRITAATLLDIRDFLSIQLHGSEIDTRQLELLQKMVELLQQLINQSPPMFYTKQEQKQLGTVSAETASSLYDIQGSMRDCKSVRTRIKVLYKNSGFTDYDPETTVDDNINQLAANYCEFPEKMLHFLDNVKSTESKDGGATYSKPFIDLLLKWRDFPKTETAERKFLIWLDILLQKLEDTSQIAKFRLS